MSDDQGMTPHEPEVLSNRPDDAFAAPSAPAYAGSPVSPPPTYLGAGDILGTPEPVRRAGAKGKLIGIGAGVIAVAGIGVGAAFAAGALGHDSSQPDALVPATAVGYVSIDLDPGFGQKVDALRFLRKFPSAKASLGSTDDIRRWVFEQATKDDDRLSQLTFDRDVKPWMGDKFGLAVMPAAAAGKTPDVVVVIQVSDEGKAKAGLKKLIGDPDDGTCSVASGYAVCAENQSVLTSVKAATAKHPLADDATFKSDVDSVGQRGIVLGWGDLDKVAALVPAGAQSLGGGLGLGPLGGLGGLSQLGAAKTPGAKAGRFVATVRFDGANVELVGKTRGTKAASHTAGSPGTGVEQLPNGTVAAVGASLDPKAISTAYTAVRTQLQAIGGEQMLSGVQGQLGSLGFHLPQDLEAVVGSKIDIAFAGLGSDGTPLVGIRSNADAAKAGVVLDKVSAQIARTGTPFTLHHLPAGQGYAVALSQSYAAQLAAGGHLGDQADFKAAVPDADKAQAVVYVNVAQLLSGSTGQAMFGGGTGVDPNLKALGSVGMSSTVDADGTGTFHLKVTTR